MVRLGIGLFAVWPFATTAFALDPHKAITQFVHTVWTEKEGAPANIAAITQTQDGNYVLTLFEERRATSGREHPLDSTATWISLQDDLSGYVRE